MSLPSIQKDKELVTVCTGDMTLWFSYQTLIAFRIGAVKVVSENCWGATTGKHLNRVDGGDKANRVKRTEFERMYTELSQATGLLG
jgi:hypothetical protein